MIRAVKTITAGMDETFLDGNVSSALLISCLLMLTAVTGANGKGS